MTNRNYYTLGLDERSCNFCIENLTDKNGKKIYDSILILEKILHKGMLSKASNSLANQLDKYYPKQKRTQDIRLIDDKKQYWTDLTIKGNSENPKDNPAYKLYKDLSLLLEYQFLNKLIIPEQNIKLLSTNK